jgi:hypothetical protein
VISEQCSAINDLISVFELCIRKSNGQDDAC